MNNIPSAPIPAQQPSQVPNPNTQCDTAMQTAVELINLQKRLGLKLTIHDKNLNNISGKFESIVDLLRNPEFISRLDQEFYISNDNETTWFKLKIRNGKLVAITFLLSFRVNWRKIINKTYHNYSFLVIGY